MKYLLVLLFIITFANSETNTVVTYTMEDNDTFLMSLTGLVCGTLLSSVILHKVL